MSRSWNGKALVDEISELLGDTSAVFKTRVLGWLNDVSFDIATRHDWGHHLCKGKKILETDIEIHDLEITPPAAPEVSLTTAGSLLSGVKYEVLVTHVQANGIESRQGIASEFVTTAATDAALLVEVIPTSSESLVTKRNIYLSKNTGKFYFHSQIADNFTQTLTIKTDTTSLIEPPDYESIRRIKGAPFFEGSPSNQLEHKDVDQLRLIAQGRWSSGSPAYFSPIETNSITVYPMPSSDMELSFNYYRNPFKIYYSIDSQPDFPIHLKPALKAGAVAQGYEYRDRDGQESKKLNYESALVDAINRGGRVANVEYSIRDVYGNFNGFEVN